MCKREAGGNPIVIHTCTSLHPITHTHTHTELTSWPGRWTRFHSEWQTRPQYLVQFHQSKLSRRRLPWLQGSWAHPGPQPQLGNEIYSAEGDTETEWSAEGAAMEGQKPFQLIEVITGDQCDLKLVMYCRRKLSRVTETETYSCLIYGTELLKT